MPPGKYTLVDHHAFPHGAVTYERELTQDEIERFELTRIISIQDHAALIIADMGRYATRYAAKPGLLPGAVRDRYQRHGVWSTDDFDSLVSEVQRQITA